MRLLIDTHIFLWWLDDSTNLSREGRAIVRDAEKVYVSAVSFLEFSIKVSIGKLALEHDLIEEISLNDFESLSISPVHAMGVHALPLLHRDPFDRLLVSQAKQEKLTLVTHDAILQKYDINVVVV